MDSLLTQSRGTFCWTHERRDSLLTRSRGTFCWTHERREVQSPNTEKRNLLLDSGKEGQSPSTESWGSFSGHTERGTVCKHRVMGTFYCTYGRRDSLLTQSHWTLLLGIRKEGQSPNTEQRDLLLDSRMEGQSPNTEAEGPSAGHIEGGTVS